MPDLIVTADDGNDFHGEIGVFYGSNSSSWSAEMTITDADIYITDSGYLIGAPVACTDLDGDGYLDLVATRSECDWPSIYVESFGIVGWYGSEDEWSSTLGTPDFELSYDLGVCDSAGNAWWREFSVGDIDGDGASEILINMYLQENPDGSFGNGDDSIWVIPGDRYSETGDLKDHVLAKSRYDDMWGYYVRTYVTEDFDEDGYSDVFLCMPNYSEGGEDACDGSMSLDSECNGKAGLLS